MSEYTFTIADFTVGNGASSNLLSYQIVTDNTITAKITTLYGTVSNVFLSFDQTLSSEEQTSLDNIITTHDPETQYVPFGDNEIQIKINESTTSTIYTTLGSIVWPPTFPFGKIVAVKTISGLDEGTSYDIRVINYTKNEVIVEMIGLTNSIIDIQCSTDIINQPDQNNSILEVQMRVDSSSSQATLSNLTISYY